MSRLKLSQLEIRGIEVGPRCLGVEDTQETGLIGMERVVILGGGGGAGSSILILKTAGILLSSICLGYFYEDAGLINLKPIMSKLVIRIF